MWKRMIPQSSGGCEHCLASGSVELLVCGPLVYIFFLSYFIECFDG